MLYCGRSWVRPGMLQIKLIFRDLQKFYIHIPINMTLRMPKTMESQYSRTGGNKTLSIRQVNSFPHVLIKIHTQQYQQLMAENVHNSIDLFREWFLQGRDPKDRCPLPARKLSQALIGMSGQRRHPFLRPAKRSKLCSGFGSGTGWDWTCSQSGSAYSGRMGVEDALCCSTNKARMLNGNFISTRSRVTLKQS